MGKPAPKFWWDFRDDNVIVQGDYPGGDCLDSFPIIGDGDAARVIEVAEGVIADYAAGRKTPNWSK